MAAGKALGTSEDLAATEDVRAAHKAYLAAGKARRELQQQCASALSAEAKALTEFKAAQARLKRLVEPDNE